MEDKSMNTLVLHQYGKNPILQKGQIPEPKQGEFLVKIQASTINPSDRLFIQGSYFKKQLPTACGIEGTGYVIKANGEQFQNLISKRVCFIGDGTWKQYIVLNKNSIYFQIDSEVPLQCAASGVVNPLTVLGFYYTMKQSGKQGIIHTAAASSLGRQLNRLCISKGVPLLNIVRRKQQVQTLKKQGAQHIINTSDEDWKIQLKAIIKLNKFDCLFDAIGGGPVSSQLFQSLPSTTKVHIYGSLQQHQPLTINSVNILFGQKIEGFMVFAWWAAVSNETKQLVKQGYSEYLKKELASETFKQLGMSQIDQAIKLSVSKASEGKILLKIA